MRLFGLIAVLGLLLGGGVLLLPNVTSGPAATPSPSASPTVAPSASPSLSPTPTVSQSPTPTATPTCSADDRLAAALAGMGVSRADVNVGVEIEWGDVPAGRVATSYNFGGSVADLADLEARLTAGDEVAQAYTDAFGQSVQASQLESGRVVAIQLKSVVELDGNFQRVGSDAQVFPTQSEVGEVVWVLLPSDCSDQDRVSVVRKVCGNPVTWGRAS